MIELGIDPVKKLFFDRLKLQNAADRAELRELARFGAFTRRRARSSIRKRKAVSQPGSPPSGHVGLYRDFIFFLVDRQGKSVVIGPAKLNKPGEAPKLLEHGGEATRRNKTGRVRRLHYRARPTMLPAFEAELQAMPPRWRGAIR